MYLDLEYEARTNGEFQHGLEARFKELDRLSALARNNPSYLGKYQEVMMDFIRYCNFNLVLLTPHFWPRYPKDEPLSYGGFPFAWQMFELQAGGFRVFRASRQLGKSTAFCCRQQFNARFLSGFKSIYVVPRNQQLETYRNKMREIEQAMLGFDRKRQYALRKNLGYKEFANGSTIEMVYVLTTASPVRGKSAQEILYDEVQEFDPDLEVEVAQIQSASPQPVTIYAGTSLTTDTMLEKKWLESSQALWVTKCGCGHENIPLPEHGVLEMIQPDGPACRKCGRLLNVRSGKFVHSFPQLVSLQRIGFHIPQIIVPAVAENPARWAKIYELLVKHGGDRKFLQEILGIAVEEGEREITLKNLMDICILGSDRQELLRKAQQRGYQFVVSGCDWGGSDYMPSQHIKVSTTVHVIMGIRPTREFDILHMRRYHGMGYEDIAGDIVQNHLLYKGHALASDFGVGAVYNSKLREKIPPERHLVFNYVGPACELISEPKGCHMFNQWSLNKSESISFTYEAVRRKRIRCYSWQYAGEYLIDFLNLFRAPGESSAGGGASTFVYRAHPTKPNDTLMATNYGYMLGKILLGEPMFADLSMKLRLESNLSSDFLLRNLPGAFSG